MSKLPIFHGSWTALITPMRADGCIDYTSLTDLVKFHIKSGTHGLVVLGTTGESATVNDCEYEQIISHVLTIAAGKIPVVVGAGTNNTQAAVSRVQKLNKMNIAGVLSVVPYYNKPTQEGLFQHFTAIAKASKHPVILYNVPGRTGTDLQPETVGRLAKNPNIVGIKEASGDLDRIGKIQALTDENFIILCGEDAIGLESMRMGAQGVISVTNNLAAADMAKMCELALQGDFHAANEINERLMPLHRALFVESNPIPAKWAAKQLGLIASDTLRLPLTPLSDAAQAPVLHALQTAKLLG